MGWSMESMVLALGVGAVAVLGGGCATLFQAGPDLVPVSSDPAGATVYLNEQPVGRTPMVVTLNRQQAASIKVEAPGYQPIYVMRAKRFNGWVIGNICNGGIGLIVDAATHNFEGYDDTPVHVTLTPATPPVVMVPVTATPAPAVPPGYAPPATQGGEAPVMTPAP